VDRLLVLYYIRWKLVVKQETFAIVIGGKHLIVDLVKIIYKGKRFPLVACNCNLWWILRSFATIKSNFNYFGRCYDYVATIDNFILCARWFLSLFSSMNRLTCPINHNSHQLSCTLRGILWWLKGIFLCMYLNFIYDILPM
jgi:hypothetical protein